VLGVVGGEESGSEERQSIWNQMKEIVKFTGPATGLWICGPLMSLIDTVVIGQGSSIELAALGTVFSCEFGVV
jgi:Na+-driven multidrug efflux pump